MFQYKILTNILYLNKQLFIFNKNDTKLCSYCNHNFAECKFAIQLWSNLSGYYQSSFDLPILNSQSATFGFFKTGPDLLIFLNHTLLLFKYYIYSPRESSKLWFAALLKNIKKVSDLEKISTRNERKTKASIKKWSMIVVI